MSAKEDAERIANLIGEALELQSPEELTGYIDDYFESRKISMVRRSDHTLHNVHFRIWYTEK